MDEGRGPPSAIAARWDDVVADLEATAEQYRDEGYEVLAIHAGDVTPLPGELALDVLAPGDEYERLQALVEDFAVDQFAVYDAVAGEVTFALVAVLDHDLSAAVLCPVFYHRRDAETFGDRAVEAGAVDLRVRPLSDDSAVTFTLEEPELLF